MYRCRMLSRSCLERYLFHSRSILNPEAIKEVRIHSKYNARFFEVEFVSPVEPEPVETVVDSARSIDFGLDNLATCVDTNGASFIVDGRKLKSINQWFNKENARLQSIKDRQKIEGITLASS